MAEQTELLIPFKDLTRVSFTCSTCKVETTLDRQHLDKIKVKWDEPQKLPQCSLCNAPPSPQLRLLLTKFLNEWPDGSEEDFKKEEVCFRIKVSRS